MAKIRTWNVKIQQIISIFKELMMRKYDWNKDKVDKAVRQSNCWFDCLDKLGVPKVGGNYRTLKNVVTKYGIDTSHFSYDYAKTHNGRHYNHRICNRTDEDIFSKGAKIKVDNLKAAYIARVLNGDAHCEICGLREWRGAELILQIHHKDGNHKNHEKSNLQLLCPNCHSQTDTFSNRKRNIER